MESESIKVSEIYRSIIGEGRYVGYPALFFRLSGCNQKCKWCDVKYHTTFTEFPLEDMINLIKVCPLDIIVWTGGEPLLQQDLIKKIIENDDTLKSHHLETNGTIPINYSLYDHIEISPKSIDVIENLDMDIDLNDDNKPTIDIMVVTDGEKLGLDLVIYASYLIPLTTSNPRRDDKIRRTVWNYCVNHNIKYSPRERVVVWGDRRGK